MEDSPALPARGGRYYQEHSVQYSKYDIVGTSAGLITAAAIPAAPSGQAGSPTPRIAFLIGPILSHRILDIDHAAVGSSNTVRKAQTDQARGRQQREHVSRHLCNMHLSVPGPALQSIASAFIGSVTPVNLIDQATIVPALHVRYEQASCSCARPDPAGVKRGRSRAKKRHPRPRSA